MTIKVMQISDYSDVYDLWTSCKGMGLNDLDDSEAGIARYLARNPHTCFVALDRNAVIGVIMAGHDGRRGYIHHTAVRESCRGRGVGRLLVEAVLDAMRTEGIHKIALVAFARNEAGNAFWESMGFVQREDLVYRNRAIAQLTRIDT